MSRLGIWTPTACIASGLSVKELSRELSYLTILIHDMAVLMYEGHTHIHICRGHQIIESHLSLKTMLPNEPKDRNWCTLPNGQKDIGTDSCYLMVRRKETDLLYPKPIYSNNFLEADLNVLVFTTLFFSLHFVTRMLWNEDITKSGTFSTVDVSSRGT